MICIASTCNYSIFCYNIEINRYSMQPESLCGLTHEWKRKMSALAICKKRFHHILIDVLVKWVEAKIEYDRNNIENYSVEQFHEHKSEKSICNSKLKCFWYDSDSKEFSTMEKNLEKHHGKYLFLSRRIWKSKSPTNYLVKKQRIEAREKKHENHLQVIVWFDCVRFAFVEFCFMHILCLL